MITQTEDIQVIIGLVKEIKVLAKLAFECARDRHYEWGHECYFLECEHHLCSEVIKAIAKADGEGKEDAPSVEAIQ